MRDANMIRKAIIMVLTLAAVAVGLLFADSYRVRQVHYTREQRRNSRVHLPAVRDRTGLWVRTYPSNETFIRVRSRRGLLDVMWGAAIEAGIEVPEVNFRWGGFA